MPYRCLVVSPPFFPPRRPILPKKSSPYRFFVVCPPFRPASARLIFLVSCIRPPPVPKVVALPGFLLNHLNQDFPGTNRHAGCQTRSGLHPESVSFRS